MALANAISFIVVKVLYNLIFIQNFCLQITTDVKNI